MTIILQALILSIIIITCGVCEAFLPQHNQAKSSLTGRYPKFAIKWRVHQPSQVHTRIQKLYAQSITNEVANRKNNNSIQIHGLLSHDDFIRYDGANIVLDKLPTLLHDLLQKPLPIQQALEIFDPNVKVQIQAKTNLELSSSCQEMVNLVTAMYWAVETSAQASSFVRGLGLSMPPTDTSSTPRVTCNKLTVNENATTILVDWQVDLPESGLNITNLKGSSILKLGNGKIITHTVQRVGWNNEIQAPAVVWRALSALRETVRDWNDSPLFQSLGSVGSSFLQQLSPRLREQAAAKSSNVDDTSIVRPPIYVAYTNGTSVPLVEYEQLLKATTHGVPVPGSSKWQAYARLHHSVYQFVNTTLPDLVKGDTTMEYLDDSVAWYTSDGSLLVEGSVIVAKLYQALSSLWCRTQSQWSLKSVQLLNNTSIDGSLANVKIKYETLSNSTSDALISGTDVYTLKLVDDRSYIKDIRQKQLNVNGSNQTADGVWLMRSLVALAEAGRLDSRDVVFWSDIMQRIGRPNIVVIPPRPISGPVKSNDKKKVENNIVTDKAALVTFRLMQDLHSQWQGITTQNNTSLPVVEYTADNVKLIGFLDEQILQGRGAYTSTLGLIISTLNNAIASGVVTQTRLPRTVVELRNDNTIRLDVTFFLKLRTNIPGLTTLNLTNNTIPVALSFKSEYVCDTKSGLVASHRLIESRVNGRLTPADIMSQWIRRQRGQVNENDNNAPDWLSVVTDAMQWLDRLNKSR